MMETIDTLTLGEIVKQNYKAADVLEKFSLDFCCKGHQKLEEACATRGIDPGLVRTELEQVLTSEEKGNEVEYDAWPLRELVDYIIRRHHKYVETQTPKIQAYLEKLGRVHGDRHPELFTIRQLFNEVGGELAVHMKKEELMLFPFIKKIERAKETNTAAESPLFSSVKSPVKMMMDDHAEEGVKFEKIAELSGNYEVPTDGCSTYALTYQLLKEFERDLHLHIHLENNILFPKSIRLEAELSK